MSKRILSLFFALLLLLCGCEAKVEQEELPAEPPVQESHSNFDLPSVSEPDENGVFPAIHPNAWNCHIENKIGEPLEQGSLEDITPFLETSICVKWLNDTYPDISDWKVLCEQHEYVYFEESYDPYTFQWRGQYVPKRIVVLATEQSEEFDRLFIRSNEWCQVEYKNGMYYPTLTPSADAFPGWEKDWQLDDYADVMIKVPTEYAYPCLWNEKAGRAVLFSGAMGFPVANAEEEPWGLLSVAYNKAQHSDGNWYFELMKGEQQVSAYYNANTQLLSVFEQSEGCQYPVLLESDVMILQAPDKILFYNIGDDFSTKPVTIIGGEGNGLSDGKVVINYRIEEENGEYALLYFREDEKIWRVLSFNRSGEILCDFATPIAVEKTELMTDYFYIEEGVLHFRYYPEGMRTSDPFTDYQFDLRSGEVGLQQESYEFQLGNSGTSKKTLKKGSVFGSWTLENLDVSCFDDDSLHHVFADFSGEVTLEGTIVRNGMMENGYDFIIKESDRFYFPRIPEGREVSRLYMDISEETKAMLNLNWDEELPAKITISNYTYRFAYTEAMSSVNVTRIEHREGNS